MLNETEETKAFWALFADELAKPLPPIPLHQTPIYAEMMAELWREEFYGWKTRVLLGVDQRRPADQYTINRKPILKRGRKR